MKPNFALNLSHDGIGLYHRIKGGGGKGGWTLIGDVPLDDPALGEKLAVLRKTASDLEKGGLATKLIIPNSQILYTEVEAPGPDDIKREVQIRAGLEGLTPYQVGELVFDWRKAKGKMVQVAVLARETLDEAEQFAKEHRLNPVSFVARPKGKGFRGEVFFGKASSAAALLGPGENVEPDHEPVPVLPASTPAMRETAPEKAMAAKAGKADKAADKPEPPVKTDAKTKAKPGTAADIPADATSPKAAAEAPAETPSKPPIAVDDDARIKALLADVPEPARSEKAGDQDKDAGTESDAESGMESGAKKAAPGSETKPELPVLAPFPPTPDDGDGEPVPFIPAPPPPPRRRQAPLPESTGSENTGRAQKATAVTSPKPGPAKPSDAAASEPEKTTAPSVSVPSAAPSFASRRPMQQPGKAAGSGDAPSGRKIQADKTGKSTGSKAVIDPPPPLPAPPARRGVGGPLAAPVAPKSTARPSDTREARGIVAPKVTPEQTPPAKSGLLARAAKGLRRDKAGEKAGETLAADRAGAGKKPATPTFSEAAALATGKPVAATAASIPAPKPATPATGLTTPPKPVPDAKPQPKAATKPAANSSGEGTRLTMFGKRGKPAPEVRGKPKYLGLILTLILLLAMAGIALFSVLSYTDEQGSLFNWGGENEFATAAVPDLDLTTPLTDPTEPELPTTDPPAGTEPADSEIADSTRIELSGDAAAAQQAQSLTDAAAQARYAATGIWQKAPLAPQEPPISRLDDLYIASIDPPITSLDAVALPPETASAQDPRPASPLPPPAAGTVFTLDTDGLVTPSRAGTLTPGGILVFSGKPPIVPPARPGTAAPPPAPADELRGFRPKPRPTGLVEDNERANLGGLSRLELAGHRPRSRPASAQALAAATDAAVAEATAPTSQAVSTSRTPGYRPNNFAAVVARARANSANTSASDGSSVTSVSAAATTVAPMIPTRASVATQATINNAIRLNRINLIGIYGSATSRRALVRLKNGRYVKLSIGDRVDGGKVVSITESRLIYQKRGKNHALDLLPLG